MTILALDLGNTTGFALTPSQGKNPSSGVIKLNPTRFQSQGWRYVKFRQWLDQIHKTTPLNMVVFEEVHRHIGTIAAHVYGGLLATLTSWCEENQVEYSGYSVQAIKKFVTGKGNAPKEVVIAAVKTKWEPNVIDDNHADAIGLLNLHLQTVNASVKKFDFMD